MGGAKWGRDHGFVIIPLGLGIAETFPPSAVAALSPRRQFYWIHCFFGTQLCLPFSCDIDRNKTESMGNLG